MIKLERLKYYITVTPVCDLILSKMDSNNAKRSSGLPCTRKATNIRNWKLVDRLLKIICGHVKIK